jgi:DNA processing protein
LPDPPPVLYLRGDLPRIPAVAIVGTRHPTFEGQKFAESLAHDLCAAGVAVLSGGAEGIDSRAHEGALRAGGPTVVVAPAGYARPFPEENAELFADIVQRGGAYVSLVPDDVAATRTSFFPRNACLAALAHALVVVEADFRSGARNAAACARKLGRPLFAVPHAPWRIKGRGCVLELRQGARFCTGAIDVLDELDRSLLTRVPAGGGCAQQPLPFERPIGLSAEGERVYDAVAAGARHLDQVCEVTGLSVASAQGEILALSLLGVLAPDGSGRLLLARSSLKAENRTPEVVEITDEMTTPLPVASCAIVNKPET